MTTQRFAQVIGLKPEHYDEYRTAHADVWTGVLKQIHNSNIRNYSIYRFRNLLFAHYEYVGTDYEADMAKMAADPITKDWWQWMEPMQNPVPEADPDAWWHDLEEVFHCD